MTSTLAVALLVVATSVGGIGAENVNPHAQILEDFEARIREYTKLRQQAEAGLPALFHTGQTGAGAGARGGMGIRLKYSNPMFLDDVAADFPEMPIILAHPSFPWQEEALSVATHKPNVYIDLSGWSPRYFPKILVQYANSILRHKVMFGSDWPVCLLAGTYKDVKQLTEDYVRDLPGRDRNNIFGLNAARFYGLRSSA